MMIAGVFGGVAALGLLIVAAVTFIPKVNFQTASSAGVEGFREVNGGVTVTMNPQRAKPSSDMVERGIIAPSNALAQPATASESRSVYGESYQASQGNQNTFNEAEYSKQMSAYGGSSEYKDNGSTPLTPYNGTNISGGYDGGEKQESPPWQGYQYGSDYEKSQAEASQRSQGYQGAYDGSYNGGQTSSSPPWQGYQSGYGGR